MILNFLVNSLLGSKMLKEREGVWAVPYADGVMIQLDRLPINNTVKHSEDSDAKNEKLFKSFVL